MPYLEAGVHYHETLDNRPDAIDVIEVPVRPSLNHIWNGTAWELPVDVETALKWKDGEQQLLADTKILRALEIICDAIVALENSQPLPNAFNNLHTKVDNLITSVGL